MVSRRNRVLSAALIALALVTPSTVASADSCSGASIASGLCSVGGGTTGDGVDLWGDLHSDGSATGGSGSGSSTPDECPVVVDDRCVGSSGPRDLTLPTSVHDLESFRPSRPTQSSEPIGWTIRAIPTNFISVAHAHTVAGTLLDNPADVRFTPVRYQRLFGDGSDKSTATPGLTWRALGQPAWTRTTTSHEYAATGMYSVDLVVWYSAAYRFGNQGWTNLDGLVRARADPLDLLVVAADTVLVHRGCGGGELGCV